MGYNLKKDYEHKNLKFIEGGLDSNKLYITFMNNLLKTCTHRPSLSPKMR